MHREFVASQVDRQTVRDALARIATTVAHDGSLDTARVAEALTEEVHRLVAPFAVSYRPERAKDGWALEFIRTRGFTPEQRADYVHMAAAAQRGVYLYDPLRPEVGQRNVVTTATIAENARRLPAAEPYFSRVGLDRASQSRILVCDGPFLLAWVGVFFPDGPPGARETWLLRRLALGARRLLRASRGFPRGMSGAALDTVLDAYPGEAYLVRAGGNVELANPLGAERLRDDAREMLGALGACVRGESSEFLLRPIRGDGLPSLFLATRQRERTSALRARLEHARELWALTPRETDVLGYLAAGDATKDIAQVLGVSPRTVDVHVAALLDKAKVDSRLRLVARLWGGA